MDKKFNNLLNEIRKIKPHLVQLEIDLKNLPPGLQKDNADAVLNDLVKPTLQNINVLERVAIGYLKNSDPNTQGAISFLASLWRMASEWKFPSEKSQDDFLSLISTTSTLASEIFWKKA